MGGSSPLLVSSILALNASCVSMVVKFMLAISYLVFGLILLRHTTVFTWFGLSMHGLYTCSVNLIN